MVILNLKTLQDLERFAFTLEKKDSPQIVLVLHDFREDFPIDEILNMGVDIVDADDQNGCDILITVWGDRKHKLLWVDLSNLKRIDLTEHTGHLK